jgi:hypothetical protein
MNQPAEIRSNRMRNSRNRCSRRATRTNSLPRANTSHKRTEKVITTASISPPVQQTRILAVPNDLRQSRHKEFCHAKGVNQSDRSKFTASLAYDWIHYYLQHPLDEIKNSRCTR